MSGIFYLKESDAVACVGVSKSLSSEKRFRQDRLPGEARLERLPSLALSEKSLSELGINWIRFGGDSS